jgi:rod shape-determining protein MreB
VIRPLSQGAIAHLDATVLFLRHLIDMLMRKRGLFGPAIAVSIPFDLTSFERDAVRKAGIQGGARSVVMIEDPYSAAVGAGIDLLSPEGALLLDIGSGVTEISLLSCGSIVASCSVRSAGWDFEQEIIDYLDARYRGRISRHEAEMLKLQLCHDSGGTTCPVHAKDRSNSLPHAMQIPLSDVREALQPGIRRLIDFIRTFLRTLPPDFAPGIKEKGIYLTGGSALLGGLKSHIEKEFSLQTLMGQNPLQEIALGAGKIIEDRKLFSHFVNS